MVDSNRKKGFETKGKNMNQPFRRMVKKIYNLFHDQNHYC